MIFTTNDTKTRVTTPAAHPVAVVDDDASVRQATSRLLRSAGLEVQGFATAAEFLESYDSDAVGCLVPDVALPGLSGLELQRVLLERGDAPPIVFLTGAGDIPTSVQAIKRGAVDFLTKPAEVGHLVASVQGALESGRTSRADRAELADLRRRLRELTPREREVMEYVVSGRLNKQIAAEMGISEKTVKVHRGRVMEKMEVESVADLVRAAQRLGIEGHEDEREVN
jgi:FixJ family two-component response regulator